MYQLATQPDVYTLAQAPMPQVDADRKKQMDEAWKAFDGSLPDPLKVDKGQPNDNVKPNRSEPIVMKGEAALFGKVLEIEASDETTEPDTAIQKFIDGLWGGDDDNRMIKLCKIAINGGLFGQMFLKLIPAQGSMKYPRIVNLNPRNVRIVTDPEDCELILAYIIEYPYAAGKLEKRQIITRIDPDNDDYAAGNYDLWDSWTITNYKRRDAASRWEQVGIREDWLYPFAPIFTRQNLPNPCEAWGRPDLTPDLVQMNKSINFMVSNIMRIVKYHGHPKTVAHGLRSSQMDTSVDGVICLEAPDSDMKTLLPMDNFAGLLSVLADLRSDMDEQSRIPAVAQGRIDKLTGLGAISGIALELMHGPLLDKTTDKQRHSGALIRDVTRAALVLSGKIPVEQYEDYPIELHWQPILPVDKMAMAQEATILQGIGISDDTLQRQLGYDPETEAEKKADEDEQAMTAFSQGRGLPPPNPTMQQQMPDQSTMKQGGQQ
jgi:hypothetical protein